VAAPGIANCLFSSREQLPAFRERTTDGDTRRDHARHAHARNAIRPPPDFWPAAEHTGPRSGFRLRGNPYIRPRNVTRSRLTSAKHPTIQVRRASSTDTGFSYVTGKNSRTMTDKLVKKKYDRVAKRHVEFRKPKIK